MTNLVLAPGIYPGELSYEDFLGRRFTASFVVEVLREADFEARMSATSAVLGGLL